MDRCEVVWAEYVTRKLKVRGLEADFHLVSRMKSGGYAVRD